MCVAVFATAAVTAASASAAPPEFRQLLVPYTGTHAFTGVGGATTHAGVGELPVECTASTSKGKVLGPKLVKKVKITYTGCHAFTYPCGSSGKITTRALKGELVEGTEELLPAPSFVGLLLEPETAGQPWAKFKCVGLPSKIMWEGSVIARMTPPNFESHTAEAWLEEKVTEPEPGCGKQLLLNVAGAGPCHNLVVKLVSSSYSHAIWLVGTPPTPPAPPAVETWTYAGSPAFKLEIFG